jgi:hypothetical protein
MWALPATVLTSKLSLESRCITLTTAPRAPATTMLMNVRASKIHSRPDTTQLYTDDVKLDELADALRRAADFRYTQASPVLTTLEGVVPDELESLRWRRRESNPRNVPHA